ncbi:hypothetical protein [Macrococcoides caseolyticum]|uniref:hypothetical protein n=1 Tax=Macrococcoides caseolyticum TaxID=69966 RepID=UPI001F1A054A|nr:hypothetical protein [Macrococcus caseolyticus]MCE4957720.1 hypothetical protein [Macrococcus caseolyticus]
MTKKIIAIELKELQIIEKEDGTFEHGYSNKVKYPAMLTNFALKRGRDLGITEGGLLADLFKLQSISNKSKKQSDDFINADDLISDGITEDGLDAISPEKITPVIYLGIIGANPKVTITFDDFLERYHEDIEVMMQQYSELIQGLFANQTNNYAKGYIEATDSSKKL